MLQAHLQLFWKTLALMCLLVKFPRFWPPYINVYVYKCWNDANKVRAKRARTHFRVIWLCMSRVLCFLMIIRPFQSKNCCLRTIQQNVCVLRTNPLCTAYRLKQTWILRNKKGVSPSILIHLFTGNGPNPNSPTWLYEYTEWRFVVYTIELIDGIRSSQSHTCSMSTIWYILTSKFNILVVYY